MRELSIDELNIAVDGMQITRKTDVSSPLLMLNCTSDTHTTLDLL